MKRLLLGATVLACVASAAQAQSWGRGGAYTGASPSQGYYRGSGQHWCSWSAAKVCTAWRGRGGKFICPPGNMSMSCKLQNAKAQRSRTR
jgi:opacity protein-like surface antigen